MNGILRSTWFVPALAAGALAIALPAQAVEQAPPPPTNSVAHEWGTFASMVGSDPGLRRAATMLLAVPPR